MTQGERAAMFLVAVMTMDAAVCFVVLHRPVAAAVCAAMVVLGLTTAYILTRQPQ